jgi:hypothetical protein
MHIGYLWESQIERDHWEVQGVGRWIILKCILERWDGMGWYGMDWIGLIWHRIGTSGGLL